ncbi:uncharacterized protein [Dysidea avara]|uniref:uncharacterized protein isoform X1 n=1 Tax=Dysidea avara TaxID=196820 RepID=UPI00332D31C4
MNRSKAVSKLRTKTTTLDEMKSEQAKLQSQLKEFEKKQADYEEELKKAKQETEQAQQNMRHELRQLEDNKKKVGRYRRVAMISSL